MAWVTVSAAVCVVLLQCHFVHVKGEAGDLGEECKTGNICTNTTYHACDTNRDPPVCKIKVSGNCASNSDQCVAGADCIGGICNCSGISIQTNTTGLCDPEPTYVGGRCSLQCNDSNAACQPTTMSCQCKASHVVNYASYSCYAKIGQACEKKSACVRSADECAENKCACIGKNTATDDNTECKLKAGQACTSEAECATNAECPTVDSGTGNCTCKAGFTQHPSGKCSGAAGITVSVLLLMFAALVTSRPV